MTQQNNHEVSRTIKSDLIRMALALVILFIAMTLIYIAEQRFHIVERYIVVTPVDPGNSLVEPLDTVEE